ncbi:MAG: hypothetical protein ACC656_10970, partial [Candidatus Heimdallarchaeota archaeon]
KVNIPPGLSLVPSYLAADTVSVTAAIEQKNQGAYTSTFYNLMNQSIIDRISLAIQSSADFWFTAIADASPPTSTITSITSSTITKTSNSSSTTTTTTPTSSPTTEKSDIGDSPYPFVMSSVFLMLITIIIRKQ